MSKLSDLEAALETYRHKVTMLRAELGVHFVPTRIRERDMARERLAELLIEAAPALLAVARAAEGPAAEYELGGRYDGDATYPDLAAALAPLVEEADHDRA